MPCSTQERLERQPATAPGVLSDDERAFVARLLDRNRDAIPPRTTSDDVSVMFHGRGSVAPSIEIVVWPRLLQAQTLRFHEKPDRALWPNIAAVAHVQRETCPRCPVETVTAGPTRELATLRRRTVICERSGFMEVRRVADVMRHPPKPTTDGEYFEIVFDGPDTVDAVTGETLSVASCDDR